MAIVQESSKRSEEELRAYLRNYAESIPEKMEAHIGERSTKIGEVDLYGKKPSTVAEKVRDGVLVL